MNKRSKWVCVTGASKGIGAAVAQRLAREGYDLLLHYHSSDDAAESVAASCAEAGSSVHLIRADLSSPNGAAQLFARLPHPPDAVVLNAGVSHYGLVQDVSPPDFDRLINVNVRAPFFCAQLALPYMIQQQWGRIVTVSSIWGLTGASCEVLYSMTKGAVVSFTKALAKEVAPSGITVNGIAPGLIETDMIKGQFAAGEMKQIVEEIPAGRIGQPEEIAALAAFLIGEEAGYINGQVISPNGAWYC
ncbi:elongation factor P 5-aminopentanone reductase [Aneurinibacillus terranovensis]|uniref:elongation factor P 5-aminopentanone reductase n=1 Tax=Aneurinibacillus terranovensis TaxID=278991 RepID=UPI0004835881|nr:SDR family oxidoreductase [Aneurinibacillus terranovensis]